LPGDVRVSSPICESASPRMPTADHNPDLLSIPCGQFFSSLLGQGAERAPS
jgi:hypothetical protein